MLKYKAEAERKVYLEVGRFVPSSHFAQILCCQYQKWIYQSVNLTVPTANRDTIETSTRRETSETKAYGYGRWEPALLRSEAMSDQYNMATSPLLPRLLPLNWEAHIIMRSS